MRTGRIVWDTKDLKENFYATSEQDVDLCSACSDCACLLGQRLLGFLFSGLVLAASTQYASLAGWFEVRYFHWGPQTAMLAAQDPDMNRLDAINTWKGEKFSAKEWVDLFQSAGVQFIGIVSFHGTGLVNWDSQLTDWNSVKRGPKVDIVGELTK